MVAVLALAGCGPRLEVALVPPSATAPALVALIGPTPRSDLVMAAVDLILTAAGLTAAELSGVVATRGPGSFTGIRVALATAQGIANAHGIPAHGFSSLLTQAARTEAEHCLAAQPARRGFVYVQRFSRQEELPVAMDEPVAIPIADLDGTVLPVVAPEGVVIPQTVPRAVAVRSTAEALLVLYSGTPQTDPGTLVPLYLEPPPAAPPARSVRAWQPSPKGS